MELIEEEQAAFQTISARILLNSASS